MTTLMILAGAAIWVLGLALVVALCRSAAHGDQWRDDRSLERAVATPAPAPAPARRRRAPARTRASIG